MLMKSNDDRPFSYTAIAYLHVVFEARGVFIISDAATSM